MNWVHTGGLRRSFRINSTPPNQAGFFVICMSICTRVALWSCDEDDMSSKTTMKYLWDVAILWVYVLCTPGAGCPPHRLHQRGGSKVIKQVRTPRSYGLTKRQYPPNVHNFLAIGFLFGIINHMEKEQIEELKGEFEKIVKAPPFNGTVTHRTRPQFIAKWKEVLRTKNVRGVGYIDDLLRAFGKRGSY